MVGGDLASRRTPIEENGRVGMDSIVQSNEGEESDISEHDIMEDELDLGRPTAGLSWAFWE